MAFGELLQQTRVEAGVSLRELGRAVNLSAVYLSDIEGSNRKPPSPQLITKIADEITKIARSKGKELRIDPEPLLRAAMEERDAVEFTFEGEAAQEKRDALVALARRWDSADPEFFERVRQFLEAG